MKKSTFLVLALMGTSYMSAQNRGGRGGNQVVVVQANNPVNFSNGNVYSNVSLDNNVGNMNYNYVQTSNVSFNNKNVQQQINTPVNRNINVNINRNVVNTIANEDVQVVNFNGNRGAINVEQNFETVSRGNVNISNERNEIPQIVEQQQINVEPMPQIVIDNVDNELAINVNPNINVPEVTANVDLSLNLNMDKQAKTNTKVEVQKVKEEKVKEEKEVKVSPSVTMPEISFGGASKSSISGSSKKTKMKRGFSYKQHISIFQKIAAKSAGIKKILSKKKPKKLSCSVVCYQF